MEKRRLELRLKWTQVAEQADMSQAGLGAIRRGERSPSSLARARIEHALQWEPGSVDAIIAGGDPANARPPAEATSVVLELLADRERLVSGLAELEDMGATSTSAYKILREELGRVEARLQQVDRRAHKLDETGT
jgi:transcriptional regulator with XRE-family HTH domain